MPNVLGAKMQISIDENEQKYQEDQDKIIKLED